MQFPTTFSELLARWKQFHFLTLEQSSQQQYEKRLPNLKFLRRYRVEEITPSTIDALISHWVTHYPKTGQRHTFEKELDLLKIVLNYYRRRLNPAFMMPIFSEHYRAADLTKRAQAPVQSLSQAELPVFLEELRRSRNPLFSSMALTQFCLSLRVGELAGLFWEAFDLIAKTVRIERTVVWDQVTWQPRIKERPKNGKVRVLVLPDILVEELTRLKSQRDPDVPLVFHNRGRPFDRQTIAKAYNRALERLGITHVRGTHMLRKTSATIANEVTGDVFAVQKQLDHASPNETLKYVSQTGASRLKIANALNDVLTENRSLTTTQQVV